MRTSARSSHDSVKLWNSWGTVEQPSYRATNVGNESDAGTTDDSVCFDSSNKAMFRISRHLHRLKWVAFSTSEEEPSDMVGCCKKNGAKN